MDADLLSNNQYHAACRAARARGERFDDDGERCREDIQDDRREALLEAIRDGNLSAVVAYSGLVRPQNVTAGEALYQATDYPRAVDVQTDLIPLLVRASKGDDIRDDAKRMVALLVEKWVELAP